MSNIPSPFRSVTYTLVPCQVNVVAVGPVVSVWEEKDPDG